MPPSSRIEAIRDLRDAYLRLRYILAKNELSHSQEWIAECLTISYREIASMLHHLEPKRTLPDLMKDTQLGESRQAHPIQAVVSLFPSPPLS